MCVCTTTIVFLSPKNKNAGLQVSQVAIPQREKKEATNIISEPIKSETSGYFAHDAITQRPLQNLQTCNVPSGHETK
jgi:hypothetical protein